MVAQITGLPFRSLTANSFVFSSPGLKHENTPNLWIKMSYSVDQEKPNK